MTLTFNEEQRLLKDTAREFLQTNAPVAAFRALRDSRDAPGYSRELWGQLSELGWPGIIIPEQYGGLGFGFLGLAAVLEESGRTLLASPLIASCVLGGSSILLAGSESQKEDLLPRIAAGELTLALALDESHHHDPLGIAASAEKVAAGYRLTGNKTFVVDGSSAELLIVAARTAGAPGDAQGISLFLVDPDARGVRRARTQLMDGRDAARITFDAVELPADALLGEAGTAWPVLEQVLDRGRAALAAEMLGGILEVFERTVDYLRQREQFGVKIGSFQALQHRCAHMFTEIELCRTVAMDACSAVDENPGMLPMSASLAKAKLNDTFETVTNESVQMHGGIGTTNELDIGLFLKRSRVAMQLLGDSSYHRDRYATLRGF